MSSRLTSIALQDTFEDAVDTTSVRSLTNRKGKVASLQPTRPLSGSTDGSSESPEPPKDPVQPSKQQDEEGDGDTVKGESEDDEAPESPDRLSNRRSNTPSLDNIDLNDEAVTEAVTKPKG